MYHGRSWGANFTQVHSSGPGGEATRAGRDVLTDAYAFLRRAADARGDPAVEKCLSTRKECTKFLGLLSARQSVVCEEGVEERKPRSQKGVVALPDSRSDAQVLRLLTWNIAGADVAHASSGLWSVPDKLCAMRREIQRLRPDVLALQECVGEGPWQISS